ncbi:MAG: carboxypeptidase-like regulatory domain-containing protein [Acidobacteria bacterium]|nr:carboxypeptidase-like regulatory domain-containing protein [Acidobacteriota bacterium]
MKSFVLLILSFVLSVSLAFAQDAGSIKGKVRTSKGDGISSVKVIARQKNEDIKSVMSDANGKFVLNGLESGLYNVVFNKNGYSAGVMYNIEVKKKEVNDLGDRLILTVDQGTLVLIKGSVFDQNGRSIYGAKVEIVKITGAGSTRKIGSGLTTQSGEFTFRQPEQPAKFRITASAKGVSASKEISVDSAGIYRLAITLNVEK